MTRKQEQENATIEALNAKIAALEQQVAANRAAKKDTLCFRTEKHKTANSFHISFNQLFDAEAVKAEFSALLVSHDDENNCDVYKAELRDALIAKLKR